MCSHMERVAERRSLSIKLFNGTLGFCGFMLCPSCTSSEHEFQKEPSEHRFGVRSYPHPRFPSLELTDRGNDLAYL